MSVLEERIELHKKLWAGELCRPLLGFFAGGRPAAPYPDIDIATPAGDLIGKYEREARWVNSLPSDRVAVARVNYGTRWSRARSLAKIRTRFGRNAQMSRRTTTAALDVCVSSAR